MFNGIFAASFSGAAHQWHVFYITLLKIIYMLLNEVCNINETFTREEGLWLKKTLDIDESNALAEDHT